MCNRFVQDGRTVKPGERARVLMRGPGGVFEVEIDGAVFGGPARSESCAYWTKQEQAEEVIVPGITAFGEKNKITCEQQWEDVAPGSALQGLLLPAPPGKDYRLLKVLTQAATDEQAMKLGNDRAPVFVGEVPRRAPRDRRTPERPRPTPAIGDLFDLGK